jgi:putative SOS response-associated peptidase YedK
MCGLYSFRKSAEETRLLFSYIERPDFPPRQYVTPASPIPIVRNQNGARHFALVRWGLVPAWMKEVKPGAQRDDPGETVVPPFHAAAALPAAR